MNNNELLQVMHQLQAMNITPTAGNLANLASVNGWKTSRDIVNGVNSLFCTGSPIVARGTIKELNDKK